MISFDKPYYFEFFKDRIPEILLVPFVNILSHVIVTVISDWLTTKSSGGLHEIINLVVNFLSNMLHHTQIGIQNRCNSNKLVLFLNWGKTKEWQPRHFFKHISDTGKR